MFSKKSHTFFVYFTCYLVYIVQCSPALSRLLLTRVGPCLDRKGTEIVTVSEMSLRRKARDSSISGLFNVSHDIENGWTAKATMQKCHDIRNLDTCDLYKSLILIKDGCEDSEDAGLYKVWIKYITPKLQCPIRAGRYKVEAFPFSSTDSDLTFLEAKISTSIFGYTYRLEVFEEGNERLMCVDSFLRFMYVRDHDCVGDTRLGIEPAPPSEDEPADSYEDTALIEEDDDKEDEE